MPSLNVPQADFLQLPHKFRGFVAGFGYPLQLGNTATRITPTGGAAYEVSR